MGAGPCSWIRPLARPQTQRRASGTSYSTSELLTGMRLDQIQLCNRGLCIRCSLWKIIACSVAITKMQLGKTCFFLASSVYGRLLPHLMVYILYIFFNSDECKQAHFQRSTSPHTAEMFELM